MGRSSVHLRKNERAVDEMQIPGFKVVRLIAEGGMAAVYLAIQESLGRFVALKLLKKFDNPEQSNRFFNEGRIIASLNHQNIITIHDIGVFEDQHYISMEYLEGGDLKSRIKGGIAPHAALDLIEGLGNCLDFVHRKGIVHRDIKPGNILFRKNDTPVLTDFGIAKQMEQDNNLTMDGTAIGSPYYLSPEQAECKPLDGRTDIYGLGILFFEMLMGRKPYRGKSYIEIVMAHKTEPIPSLSPHLQPYQGLLERMIAKDPKDRFKSAREMVKYLKKLDPIDTMEIRSGQHVETVPEAQDTAAVEGGVGTTLNVEQPLSPPGLSHPPQSGDTPGGESLGYRFRWPIMAMVAVLIAGTLLTTYHVKDDFVLGSNPKHAVKQPSKGVSGASGDRTVQGKGTQGRQSALGPAAVAKQQGGSGNTAKHDAAAARIAAEKQARVRKARRIKAYLYKARESLRSNRLTTPADDNAYYYYRRVVALSPSHKEALAGLTEIANRYSYMARKEMDRGDEEKAKVYIERGLKVDRNNRQLAAISEEIAAEEAKNRKIAEYLSAAKRSLSANKLTKPPRDNAHFYYREVLKLSPGHREAKQGVKKVANRYADLAEREITEYRYDKAKEFVNLGLRVQPGNPRLVELKTRTNSVEHAPRRFIGTIKSIFDLP